MRARRRIGAIVALIALGYAATRFIGWGVYQSHPLGSTTAPYGFVELPADKPGPRPLLLVLHGAGGVGDGKHPLDIVDRAPLSTLARWHLSGHRSVVFDEGTLIVAPQSPGQWDPALLDQLVSWVIANRSVDPDRIYVTGPSMGGCGTWRYAAEHPERLAAVMPICGGCTATGAMADGLKTLPVRAFHAWDDDVVPNYFSATWVATIAQLRGSPKVEPMKSYPQQTDATFDGQTLEWKPGTAPAGSLSLTELWTGGHWVFNQLYEDESNWVWLFVQRRSKP